MALRVGQIYRHAKFYVDLRSGEMEPKFLLILAAPAGDDLVVRLLTSRYAGLRPEVPPCYHGDPYAGFYLGVLGGELTAKSWLDLRYHVDLDLWDVQRELQQGVLRFVMDVPAELLRPVLACAANADDTTPNQGRKIRDAMAALAM